MSYVVIVEMYSARADAGSTTTSGILTSASVSTTAISGTS